MLGKTEHRLALVILITALLPLASAMLLAYSLLNYASSVWLRPEVKLELDRGIDLYKDYIGAIKDDMRHQTDAMAAEEALRIAARRGDGDGCAKALLAASLRHPQLVSLAVEDELGKVLAAGAEYLSDPASRRSDNHRLVAAVMALNFTDVGVGDIIPAPRR